MTLNENILKLPISNVLGIGKSIEDMLNSMTLKDLEAWMNEKYEYPHNRSRFFVKYRTGEHVIFIKLTDTDNMLIKGRSVYLNTQDLTKYRQFFSSRKFEKEFPSYKYDTYVEDPYVDMFMADKSEEFSIYDAIRLLDMMLENPTLKKHIILKRK